MTISPYATAAELSRALASRAVSSVELTEAAIARIDALDGPINAICVKTYDRARAAAKGADERLARGERGALLGVPITIKELFNLTGTPTTWGFPAARDFRPDEDALAVQRVEKAGAAILGKTNVPLALGDWQSYNDIYGVTNNPFDLTARPAAPPAGPRPRWRPGSARFRSAPTSAVRCACRRISAEFLRTSRPMTCARRAARRRRACRRCRARSTSR